MGLASFALYRAQFSPSVARRPVGSSAVCWGVSKCGSQFIAIGFWGAVCVREVIPLIPNDDSVDPQTLSMKHHSQGFVS